MLGVLALVGIAVVQAILDAIKEHWPLLLGLVVIAGAIAMLIWALKHGWASTPAVPTSNSEPQRSVVLPSALTPVPDSEQAAERVARWSVPRDGRATRNIMNSRFADDPVSVSVSGSDDLRYTLPKAPTSALGVVWVPKRQPVGVDGRTITGGLIYVGGQFGVPARERDAAVIDPGMDFGGEGDYTVDDLGYYPHYSSLMRRQRRAYIAWQASGRSDPTAAIGYVFLHFYGLERRVLVDARNDPAAVAELADIADELRRLLDIYGTNRSFKRYASHLLELIELMFSSQDDPDLDALMSRKREGSVPIALRALLGRTAMRRTPLPAKVALAWVRLDREVPLTGLMKRSPEVFNQLFLAKYAEAFGDGLILPTNRTKLVHAYKPASQSLLVKGDFHLDFSGAPDVTAVKGPIAKLAKLVAQVNEQQPVAKAAAAAKASGDALRAWLPVPADSWSPELKDRVAVLSKRIGSGVVARPLGQLVVELGGKPGSGASAQAAYVKALAVRLSEVGIGFEPDVLTGASVRRYDSTIVLFCAPATDPSARQRADYRAAQLMLELASAVASADNTFGPKEMTHLSAQVRSWTHLSEPLRARLRAYLRLLVAQPGSLAGLKKKVEPLAAEQREAIAEFMLAVAHADGVIDASEVKMLERAYRALGISAERVFTAARRTATDVRRRRCRGTRQGAATDARVAGRHPRPGIPRQAWCAVTGAGANELSAAATRSRPDGRSWRSDRAHRVGLGRGGRGDRRFAAVAEVRSVARGRVHRVSACAAGPSRAAGFPRGPGGYASASDR